MMMKKFALIFLGLIAVAATGFTDTLVIDNQTSYPMANQKTKIAVQWASSAKEVTESNNALLSGSKQNPGSMQVLAQPGKVNLTIPRKAESFRVLVWTNGEGDPDLHTNWVDVVPNKTYLLKTDHLVPTVLMAGTGC